MAAILLVDDQPEVLDLLGACFEDAGYTLYSATNGSAALRLLYEHRPDLVVTDVRMPGIDGFELVTRIRELSTVPIIVLSALGDETEREHALRLGADDYLLKTEGVQTLLERVAAVLSKPRPGARSGPSAYKDSALTIHFDRQEVFVHDRKVDLTPKEFKLLSLLVQGSDRVVSVSEDPPARVGLNPLFG